MPVLQITSRGWVAMALVIALIAAMMNRFSMLVQLTRTLGETARWAEVQMPPILGYWDLLIVSLCILLTLGTRGSPLWIPSKKPSSLEVVASPVLEDGRLQSSVHLSASVQQRARRERLATRYFWKWRLIMAHRRIESFKTTTIAAEVKHQLQQMNISEADAQNSEQANSCEEQELEPSSQKPGDGFPEVNSQILQDTLPPGPLSPIDSPKYEATAPAETSSQAESPSFPVPDPPTVLQGAIEEPPEPAFVQPQLSERCKKAKKDSFKFQKAPAGNTRISEWPTNVLGQDDWPTQPQGLPAPSFSSPRPGPWAPKNPKVPKEEQWGAEDGTSLEPESRLADMLEGPVKVTKCALDKECTVRVCGKAHHGPCTDPTESFMPEQWCRYNRGCTRSNCRRWHSSPAFADPPASADPPAEGWSLDEQW